MELFNTTVAMAIARLPLACIDLLRVKSYYYAISYV